MARRTEKALEVDQRVAALQTEVTEAEEKLKRLYQMVEDGLGEATALSLADGPLAARSS